MKYLNWKKNRVKGDVFDKCLYFFLIICISFFVPRFAFADVTTGLVGHWTFDSSDTTWAASTTNDLSGNNNAGELVGFYSSTSTVPGQVNQALNFNGANSYVKNTSLTNIGTNSAGAISFWTKLINDSSGVFVSVSDNTSNNLLRIQHAGNGFGFFLKGSGTVLVNGSCTACNISSGWHHIIVQADSSGNKVYVDGVNYALAYSVGSATSTQWLSNIVKNRIEIGAYSAGSTYFKGLIDEVRIYNRALSSQDALDLYNRGISPIVTVQNASSITATSSTLNGNIISDGGVASTTIRGFVYGTDTSYAMGTTTENGTFNLGSYSATVSNLTCNTTYHFKAYATNSKGTSYSADNTFTTTDSCPLTPTILNASISNVLTTSVTASSTIVLTGGTNVIIRGFVYGTDPTFVSVIATTSESGDFGTGGFSVSISGLTCGTTYYIKSYASNINGTTIASSQSFTTGACDAVVISNPQSYRVFQRNGNNQANITIAGTYTGSPTSIEASWNGGSYVTIASNPTGGTFSGVLANQTAGQGTLTVRFADNTNIFATSSYVGIGDIFAVAGQSNADGYGVNLHTYSHSTLKASMVDNTNTWKELTDPTSQVSGAQGSVWPLLATLLMADQNVPVAFIPTSLSGSRVSQWARNNSNPGDSSTLYGRMYTRINNVGNIKAVLWWQGESEAADNNTYNYNITSYRNLAGNIYSDFGVKTVMAQIGDRSTTNPVTALDNVRLAQRDLWNEGGNVLPGPSLYDVVLTADGVHFTTDAQQQTAANRWWAAIKQDFYGGSGGRGPILSAAQYSADNTSLYLTFTSDNLPLLPASGYSGFTVKDNGIAASISSIAKVASNQLRITLASAATGPITVSLGQGRTGTGATVPTDSSAYHLPAEIFVDQATTPLYASSYTITGPSSGNAGMVSTDFTVTPNGPYTGTITVTFSGSGSSGLSTRVLNFSNSSAPQTFTITPVVSGTVTITSTNNGALTDPSGLTYTVNAIVPESPNSVSAVALGSGSATISFSAPSFDGGSAVLYYTASSTPGNILATSNGSPIIVNGLDSGTAYTFVVYAKNAVGTSSPSPASNSITPTAPTSVSAPILASSSHGSNSSRAANLFSMGFYSQAKAVANQFNLEVSKNAGPTVSAGSFTFSRPLSLGMTGADVKLLQSYLNEQGFIVSKKGFGSPGNETTYFGPATKAALMKFQEANRKIILEPQGLKYPTGLFGEETRKLINSFANIPVNTSRR